MEKRNFNLHTILLLVLLAGLVVLYILFFTLDRPASGPASAADPATKESRAPLRIVYVNIDTLNQHYEFVKELKGNLESTGSRLQREILAEQGALEKEAEDFQRSISRGGMTEAQAQVIYEELMRKQQALMEKKERYTQQVADQEYDMNLELLDTVDHFLARYNRQYRYDFIMAYRTAGEILMANDSLDITREVLEQLNREYAGRKK